MKRLLIFTSILIYGYTIFAQNLDSISELISDSYNKAYNCDSLKYKQNFFNVFPDNFQLFNTLYGWNKDEEKPQMMYNLYEKHLSFFCNLHKIISVEDYSHKIIKLVINGYWDADAVNILQNCIRDFVSSNLQLFINILSQYPNNDIIKFWTFFYDCLYCEHPTEMKLYTDLSDKIKSVDLKMFQLMKEARLDVINK